MEAVKLYKYLDFTGGLMMLHYSNLQFTNATQLNDPFDCHPSLIDFSNSYLPGINILSPSLQGDYKIIFHLSHF